MVLFLTVAAGVLSVVFMFLLAVCLSIVGLLWNLLFSDGYSVSAFFAWAIQAVVTFWISTETWIFALLMASLVPAIALPAAATPSVTCFEFDTTAKVLSISTHRALSNRTRSHVVPFEFILAIAPYQDWNEAYFVVQFVDRHGETNTLQLGRGLPLRHCVAHIEWLHPTLGDKFQPMSRHES